MLSPDMQVPQRTVFHHGRIYTVDPKRPVAEAMVVDGDRIRAVGSNTEVLSAYPGVPRIDLRGQTVVPGLIDAHAHLMGLGTSMLHADLTGAASVSDVIARLQSFVRQLEPGSWLLGRGWDQNHWPSRAFPSRLELDAAFPDRPVWLTRIDVHAGWANTAALRLAGEASVWSASDPEGGKILRDEGGDPTGVFLDSAMDFVQSCIPPPGPEEQKRALRLALGETARYGITSVHDAGIGLDTIALYKRAIDEGWFGLRLYGMIGGMGETFDRFCAYGPLLDYGGRLTVRSVKFFMDGALGSRGAALLEDYSDDPDNRGLLRQPEDGFTEDVRRPIACGFQVNTHAIGDRANRVVLNVYERAMQAAGPGRHRIEHAQVVAPEDIPRFARLGVIASMQPTHATSDMRWAEDRLGPDRIRDAYAWRRFLDAGVVVPFGSDFPIEHVNPLLGFYAAVTRQDVSGRPEGGWCSDQCLTRAEALRAFTLDAAYAAFQEDVLGSLTPGKYADFTVLSDDIMTIPASEIPAVQVVATYLGGLPIYGSLRE